MRITRDTMLKIARDTAAQRVKVTRRVLCIYLTGSCLQEDALIGGCGDIDLVMVQDGQPLTPREIVRLNDEISLDITHYAQEDFSHPRQLRVSPWMGPILYNKPLVLHDSNHWFDYVQAATGAQFLQPDNALARARQLAETARRDWLSLSLGATSDPARQVYGYYKILENAGNAIASLTGVPLTERRFLLNLPQRAAAIQQAELSAVLLNLAGGNSEVTDVDWRAWMASWEAALLAVAAVPGCPLRLQAARKDYYLRSAAALWESNPIAAFWIMARTWSLAAAHLPEASEHRAAMAPLLNTVGLNPEKMDARLEELDSYLDRVEEGLDRWAQKNGVVSS
jgi:hypothetical protein